MHLCHRMLPLVALLLATASVHADKAIDWTWPVAVPVLRSLATNNNACGQDSTDLLDALNNATYWAVRMADASGNLPSGLLSGNIYSMGDFDGCMENIQAHYCLVSAHFNAINDSSTAAETISVRPVQSAITPPPRNTHAWQHMQRAGERWRALRDEVNVAVCVPATCTSQEIRHAVRKSLSTRFSNLGVTLDLGQVMCTTKNHLREPFSAGEIAFCVLIATLITTVLITSLMECISPQAVGTVLRCFSMQHQLSSLFQGHADRGGNVFLDFLRFFSVLLIVMSHKMEYTMIGPLRNPNFIETSYTKIDLMPLLNPSLVVDTFFFLGGLALAGKLLYSSGNISLWSLYLQRYIRLTPPYLLLVFFYATLLPRLGSGPLWTTLVFPESRYCQKNWWTNALYINNYVKPDEMCLMHSWYLPCDMHLYIASAPLVMLLARRPRLGLVVLTFFGIASCLLPFFVIYFRDTDPFLLVFFEFLRNDRNYPYFTEVYVKSHLRASPYLGGILAGYLTYRLGKKPWSMAHSIGMLVLGIILSSLTAISGAPFYMDPEGLLATSTLGRAFYGAGHRVFWAAGMTLIVSGATSLYRNKRLSAIPVPTKVVSSALRATFPLASLCYCAYLIHILVIIYGGATVRDPVYTDEILLGIRAFGDTTASFLLALGLYLLTEAPARELAKIALTPSRRNRTEDISILQVPINETWKSSKETSPDEVTSIFIARL